MQYSETLNRLGLLESLDAIAFAMLCDAVAGYQRIRNELATEQLVILTGESGYPTPNPLCALMRSQAKGVRELLSDFGMTPASRTSLTGSTSVETREAEIDPVEALLNAMHGGETSKPAEQPAKAAKKQAARKTTVKKPAATKAATKAARKCKQSPQR